MNRLIKLILAFALAFLAVIIGVGIGNRLVPKKVEPISPAEVSVIAEEAKEKEDKIKAVIEERRKKEQKSLEEVSPPVYSPGREAYPETEFPSPSELEEGMPPEMYPYPPGYFPDEYDEYLEEGMPPEMYPPQAYPPPGHPSEEFSEGQYPPYGP